MPSSRHNRYGQLWVEEDSEKNKKTKKKQKAEYNNRNTATRKAKYLAADKDCLALSSINWRSLWYHWILRNILILLLLLYFFFLSFFLSFFSFFFFFPFLCFLRLFIGGMAQRESSQPREQGQEPEAETLMPAADDPVDPALLISGLAADK